jgi:hypothetical protein
MTQYQHAAVNSAKIVYREAGPTGTPIVLLLDSQETI